jgi:dolichyl-phosphate-mannose-protein mannosyltransferase
VRLLIRNGEEIAVFAVTLVIVIILQILGGVYLSSFGGYPDESMHFVSALMVRDFLAGLDFHHPWHFAQQYYLHYPRVGIGHWPPIFHGTLGTWFIIFGVSRGASMVFIAIVAAATASVIYLTGKHLIARWAGALAAVLFVASPLAQESSALVMTEHLYTLAMLVSTLCFARFVRAGRVCDSLAFGIAAALAILTSGSAWALGLVPGLTLALTNRWYLLRRPGFWLGAIPVLVACVPWYVLTRSMQEGTWEGGGASFLLQALPDFCRSIYLGAGLPVLIFAFIGIWATIGSVKNRADVMPEWAALAGLVMATFVFHCVLPVGTDGRYMLPLVPSLVLFSAAGIRAIAHRLAARLPTSAVHFGLAGTLLVAFCVDSFALPLRLRNGGDETLVRDVETRVSHVPQVWLISSGPTGEGSLVAAIALQEARRGSYVLLGKKILAGGDMLGRNTEDRFDTPEKLAALLDEIPVTLIVIDDQVPLDKHYPYHDRLRKLVARESDRWELIGSYPETSGGNFFENALHVYARRPVATLALGPPAVRLDRVINLIARSELR